jgi:hypothetical protein
LADVHANTRIEPSLSLHRLSRHGCGPFLYKRRQTQMKRNIISVLTIALAFVAVSGTASAANDRLYTAAIIPSNVPPGGIPTNFNLIVTNNILSGPSHFLRQIVVTVPQAFTISGLVTVQAPVSAPLPWKATVSGNTITVVSGSTSDASVTAGQSVTITVPAVAPSLGCPGGSYTWGISASQVIGGGGAGNAYLPTPGSPAPIVSVTCDTQTSLTLNINPDSIITTDAAAQVTLTARLTKSIGGAALNHEPVTFTVGGQQVPCIGNPIYTDVNGIATCSYLPQASPNTPLPAGVYDALASFAGDASLSPHLGSSGAGPVKLNVNATGTGLAVSSLTVPYSPTPQAVTLTATLTGLNFPLGGKTVSFTLGSTSAGTTITNGSGVATVNATLPVLSPGTTSQYIKASFAGDNTYSAANGDAPLTVGPISGTISFVPASLTQTYTGTPLSPTVITNPAGLSYSVTGFPQTNAGNYTVSAVITDPSYAGGTGNQTFTINQAYASIVLTPYNATYDTNPHTASVTVTGVQGEDLSGGLSANTTHTNAGTYVDSWIFNGGQNYVSTSGTVTDIIKQASSSVTVIGGTFVYDTSPHPATASASTTVGSLAAPVAVTITYSGTCSSAPTTVPDGSSCTATGTYAGDGNHAGSFNTATITISKAPSSVSVTGGTFIYDGAAHAATGLASTAVGTLTNPASVAITYSGSCTVAPTTVAESTSCTATGTYLGDANHSGNSGTTSIIITKAGQTITFTSMIVSATASSGLAVSFSTSTPNVCSVGPVLDTSSNPVPGKALVMLKSGTWAQCSVVADQVGSNDVTPAPEVTAVLTAP